MLLKNLFKYWTFQIFALSSMLREKYGKKIKKLKRSALGGKRVIKNDR